MALFERSTIDENEDANNMFPTEPAFLVPVEVRDTVQYGPGHKGVFAMSDLPPGTKFWVWTDRVTQIHSSELVAYMAQQFGNNVEQIRVFLQQGFVLPGTIETTESYFCSNPTDAGRFMNHSANPNCGPDGTLQQITAGDEMTMDYAFHGDPE
eukprot:scaffold585888_cov63-Attheya_sp.AAC.1